MATLEQRVAELEAIVATIAKSPKVAPYIDGGTWPRPLSFAAGTISSGDQDNDAAKAAIPEPSKLIDAREHMEAAQRAFDAARAALMESQQPKTGPMIVPDQFGDAIIVDPEPVPFLSVNMDTEEGRAVLDAERALIRARTNVYRLEKELEQQRQQWLTRRNRGDSGGFSITKVASRVTGRR